MARERMTKVVSPLFELLEPVMCRAEIGRPVGTLRAVISVIQRSSYLSGGRLWAYRDKEELIPESKDAKDLSLLVSREYDSLCKSLGIPLRTLLYRNKTYKPYFFLREMGQKLKEGLQSALCVACIAFVLLQIFVRTVWAVQDKGSVAALMQHQLVAAAALSVVAAILLCLLIKGMQRNRGAE